MESTNEIDNLTINLTKDDYVCYLLKSTISNRTYIGSTNNFKKRIRQHNGEIKGGAKYTHSNRPWIPVCIVSGFPDKSHALCFEWRVKRKIVGNKFKTVYLINNRVKNIFNVLNLERFTKKCNLTTNYYFNLIFYDKNILNDLKIENKLNNISIIYNESYI